MNTSVIGPSVCEIAFNDAVENIRSIIREARHMGTSKFMEAELPQFMTFLDDVNFKVSFVSDPEDYIMDKMLDAMDRIVDVWFANAPEKCSNAYRVSNSIYDVIKEFYFGEK